jgi:hypothetical protein
MVVGGLITSVYVAVGLNIQDFSASVLTSAVWFGLMVVLSMLYRLTFRRPQI